MRTGCMEHGTALGGMRSRLVMEVVLHSDPRIKSAACGPQELRRRAEALQSLVDVQMQEEGWSKEQVCGVCGCGVCVWGIKLQV